MVIRFPCNICTKSVNNNHKAILCDLCDKWVHIKCNKFDKKDYTEFQNNTDKTFYCIKCLEDIIPFTNLLDNEFDICVKKGINFLHNLNSEVKFSHSPDQKIMFGKINNLINKSVNQTEDVDDDDNENNQSLNCKYYSIEEFLKGKFKTNSFSILHLNTFSSTSYRGTQDTT